MKFLKRLGIPLFAFIIFFVVQSFGFMSENTLTAFIIVIIVLTASIHYHRKELLLFITGCLFGLIIEIGLRYFGYQQVWTDASLFGVPYWLPLIWGFGFVIITRLGVWEEYKKLV